MVSVATVHGRRSTMPRSRLPAWSAARSNLREDATGTLPTARSSTARPRYRTAIPRGPPRTRCRRRSNRRVGQASGHHAQHGRERGPPRAVTVFLVGRHWLRDLVPPYGPASTLLGQLRPLLHLEFLLHPPPCAAHVHATHTSTPEARLCVLGCGWLPLLIAHAGDVQPRLRSKSSVKP